MTHPWRAAALVAIVSMAAGGCWWNGPHGGGYPAVADSVFTVIVKGVSTSILPESIKVRPGTRIEWRLPSKHDQVRIVFDDPTAVHMSQDSVWAGHPARATAPAERGRYRHHAAPLQRIAGEQDPTAMVPAVLIVE